MPINSKYHSICDRLVVICRGRSEIPKFGGYGGVRGRDLYQSKAHLRLLNTSQYKVLLYLIGPWYDLKLPTPSDVLPLS